MAKAIEDIGYHMVIDAGSQKSSFKSEWDKRKEQSEIEWKQMKKRLISSILILIPLMYISMGPMIGLPSLPIFEGEEHMLILGITQLLMTIVILVINKHFFHLIY